MAVRPLEILAVILCATFPARGALLAPNSTVTQTVAAGQDFTCTLEVPSGQAAELLIVEKQAFAGIVEVRGEDGSEVEAELAKRSPIAKRLTLISGRFEIRFRPANHSPLERIFELQTSEFHPATEADHSRAAAEKLLGEGEQAERNSESASQDEALRKYEAALVVWKRLRDRPGHADTLRHIGWIRQARYEMPAARENFQQALELSRAESDSSGMGWALIGLSGVATDTGQAKQGLAYADQASEIWRSNGDPRQEAQALLIRNSSISGSGDVVLERANYVQAVALAQRAGDRLLEARAQNFLGVLEMRVGDFKTAQTFYLRALEIDRDENNPVLVARVLSNLGAMHANIGEYREALQYLEQALPVRKNAGPEQYGNTVYNIAFDHAQLGEYQKALDEYGLALSLFRQATFPYGQAYVFEGLANVYTALKDDEKAEEYLKQGLAVRRAIPDRQGEAILLNRLGNVAARRGRREEALRLYRQALAINEAAGYQMGQVDSHDNLAEALIERDPHSALDELTHSLEASRKLGNKQRESNEFFMQGQALRQLNQRAASRTAFQNALEIRHAAGAAQQEAQTLLELARLDRVEERLAEANDKMANALDLIESLRSNIGSREARMRLASSYRGFYDLAIDVAMKRHDPARALEFSERARARSLVELLSEAKIDLRQGVDPALLASERQVEELLDGKHDRYMRLLGSSHTPASEVAARKELDQLVARYEAIESEIRTRSPRYAAMSRPQPITVAEIQSRLLESGTVLLEFWLGEDRSYAWIVSKESCRGFELPARSIIEALARRAYTALTARNLPATTTVEEYQRHITAAKAEFAGAFGELSRKLLQPISPAPLA